MAPCAPQRQYTCGKYFNGSHCTPTPHLGLRYILDINIHIHHVASLECSGLVHLENPHRPVAAPMDELKGGVVYRICTVPLTFEPIAKGQISLCRSDSPPLYGLFNKLSSWPSTAARLLLPETNSSSIQVISYFQASAKLVK